MKTLPWDRPGREHEPNWYPWTMEARADYGHQIIDVARTADEAPCWTLWFAYPAQLNIPGMAWTTHLHALLTRMHRAGVLERSGGQYRDDDGDLRVAALVWRLAVDRHQAHEVWTETVARPHWWSGRP